MKKTFGKILFVGSIPGASATDVMRQCAQETGNFITFLPDGETGKRTQWVQFLAAHYYHGHPDMVTLHSPAPKEGIHRWHNEAYHEQGWVFKIKDGVTRLRFDSLGYAAAAIESYHSFCALREAGEIPAGTRFQVSLPLTESATRLFVTNAGDFSILKEAYEDAMVHELDEMLTVIPAGDLAVQWDMALEVLFSVLDGKTPWAPDGNVDDRLIDSLNLFAAHLPEEVIMGCHLCYGDLGHQHLVEPPDLALAVQMANEIVKKCNRPVDYFHMPVPRDRKDDDYFKPLNDLNIGATKLYLGLIHITDGVDGANARIAAAHKFVTGFGVATECGMGRRAAHTMPELLHIHREVAAAL